MIGRERLREMRGVDGLFKIIRSPKIKTHIGLSYIERYSFYSLLFNIQQTYCPLDVCHIIHK